MIPSWIGSPRRKSTLLFLVSIAVLGLSLLPSTSADYEHYCNPDSFANPQRGICGDNLVDHYNYLCSNFAFIGKYVAKRSSYPKEIDSEVRDLLVNKKDAYSFLSKRQSEQNIYCECCVNHCNVMELLQYCPPPSSRRIRSEHPKVGV